MWQFIATVFVTLQLMATSGCITGTIVRTVDTAGGVEIEPGDFVKGAVYRYRLPKGKAKITIAYTTKGGVTAKVSEPLIVPDGDKTYYLSYETKGSSHDIIDITSTAEGLLTKVSTTEDDRTVEIVKQSVAILQQTQTALAAAGGPAPPAPAPPPPGLDAFALLGAVAPQTLAHPTPCGDFSFDVYVDLTNLEIESENIKFDHKVLKGDRRKYFMGIEGNCYMKYMIDVKQLDKLGSINTTISQKANEAEDVVSQAIDIAQQDGHCAFAVCFRVPVEYSLSMEASLVQPLVGTPADFRGVYYGIIDPSTINDFEIDEIKILPTGALEKPATMTKLKRVGDGLTGMIEGEDSAGKPWKRRVEGTLKKEEEPSKMLVGQLHFDPMDTGGNNIGSIMGSITIAPTGTFIVKISGVVKGSKTSNERTVSLVDTTANLWAPAKEPLGVLFFWRKQFIKNETTATFKNGMLTGLRLNDPSQVEEFLSLPIEILKAVPIIIAIN